MRESRDVYEYLRIVMGESGDWPSILDEIDKEFIIIHKEDLSELIFEHGRGVIDIRKSKGLIKKIMERSGQVVK